MKYKLRNTYSTNPMTALRDILKDRGVQDIDNFLYPSFACELNPYNLNNIEAGAKMLLKHLHENNNILFLVDADCDGFTSSAVLWLYIKSIFPTAKLSFTVHEHKQHGLNDKIDWIEDNPNYSLVIVPDAGSYDVNEHLRLGELGIDCLVLDHHEQLLDDNGNPIISNVPSTIVINNQLSPNYKNKSLCGVGIVYKFCEVLDDTLGVELAHNFLDLVALGEIADVMDRTNIETNYLMLEGLSYIQNKGFQVLLESQSFSLKEKAVCPWTGLTPIDVAFYIAPLINAITRVGTIEEKEAMFYCFIEPDKQLQSTKRGAKIGDIETAAEQTARVGKNAKARQDKAKEKALDLIDFKIQKEGLLENNIIVIELTDADKVPQELSGLIAMGIVTKYNKPCLIVRRNSEDLLQGSARNNANFSALPNLKEYLEKSGYFEYVAGHANAFGQGIKATKLNKFIEFINKDLPENAFENCYTVDYILDGENDNVELLTALSSHPELFGNHIEEIKVVIKNISLANIMIMGANKDSMKISFNNIDYVKFKDNKFIDEIMNNRTKLLTVYGRINLNEFMGRTSVQLFIEDYQLEDDKNKYDF